MASSHYHIQRQRKFLKNAKAFLSAISTDDKLDRETLDHIKTGACSGLTKSLIRAWRGGRANLMKYIARHNAFCSLDNDGVKKISGLYKHYKQFRAQLNTDSNAFFAQLRAQANPITQEKITELIAIAEQLKRQEILFKCRRSGNPIFIEHGKSTVKNNIRTLRNKREELIDAIFIGSNHSLEQDLLFAKEIYLYIHSVIFLQNRASINLIIEDHEKKIERALHHDDILEHIDIIAPDDATELKKVASFGFTLQRSEILTALNTLVKEGDLVYLTCRGIKLTNDERAVGHALLLLRQANQWLLVDPNQDSITWFNDDNIADKIIDAGFTLTDIYNPDEHYPIKFQVLANSATYDKIPRDECALVDTLLNARSKKDKNINIGQDMRCSSLDLAIQLDNPPLARRIIQRGGTTNSETITFARSNAMRRELLTGGILGLIKRHWKMTLVAILLVGLSIGALIVSGGTIAPLLICPAAIAITTISYGYNINKYEKINYFDEKPIPPKKTSSSPIVKAKPAPSSYQSEQSKIIDNPTQNNYARDSKGSPPSSPRPRFN